ncbi:MAG: hypothetical protein ACE5G7_00895 [Candidatus Hydrothermarchaeaceae archaeon]
MVAVCEFAERKIEQYDHGCYNIFTPGDAAGEVENYLLVSIDGIGFVVIRQTIDIGGEG